MSTTTDEPSIYARREEMEEVAALRRRLADTQRRRDEIEVECEALGERKAEAAQQLYNAREALLDYLDLND